MINLGLKRRELKKFHKLLMSNHRVFVRIQLMDLSHNYIEDLSDKLVDGQVNIDADADVTRTLDLVLHDPRRHVSFSSNSPAETSLDIDRMLKVWYCVGGDTTPDEPDMITPAVTQTSLIGQKVNQIGVSHELAVNFLMPGGGKIALPGITTHDATTDPDGTGPGPEVELGEFTLDQIGIEFTDVTAGQTWTYPDAEHFIRESINGSDGHGDYTGYRFSLDDAGSSGVSSSYADQVIADGALAYYRLGESLAADPMVDSSGTADGTYQDTAGLTLGRPALASNVGSDTAAHFNSGAHGRVHTTLAPKPSSITVEAWIRPDVTNKLQEIVTRGSSSATFGTAHSWRMAVLDGGALWARVFVNGTGTTAAVSSPAGTIVAGQKYYVAFTYDQAFIRLYVNGVEVASIARTGGLNSGSYDLVIGTDYHENAGYFIGEIDEVAVYGTAHSAAKIANRYELGSSVVSSKDNDFNDVIFDLRQYSEVVSPEYEVDDITWYEVPIFCGPVTDVERNNNFISVVASGKESMLFASMWRTKTFKKGLTKTTIIKRILNLAGETKISIPDDDERAPRNISLGYETIPWRIAKNRLAIGMNKQLFYNGRGVAKLRNVGTKTLFKFDKSVVKTQPRLSYEMQDFHNAVLVIGAKPKGRNKRIRVRRVAPKNHPLSPWKLERNGVPQYKPLVVRDDGIRSKRKARRVAKNLLKQELITAVDVQFDSLVIPHLEELDACRLDVDAVGLDFRIRRMTIPLLANGSSSIGAIKRSIPNKRPLSGGRRKRDGKRARQGD